MSERQRWKSTSCLRSRARSQEGTALSPPAFCSFMSITPVLTPPCVSLFAQVFGLESSGISKQVIEQVKQKRFVFQIREMILNKWN